MDALSDVLRSIRLNSAFYFKSDFSAPWGMDIPTMEFAQFHIVVKGQCLLQTIRERILLKTGDIVIFPNGTKHWIADSETSPRLAGAEVLNSIQEGCPVFRGNVDDITLICGHFEFDRSLTHSFVNDLPDVLHVRVDDSETRGWIERILELVSAEANRDLPGQEVVIQKLGEILFVHSLRAYIAQTTVSKGMLAALFHKKISRAMKLIHSSYHKPLQIDDLAKSAGMSRTNFINTFRSLTGETPMNYVLQWRILKAIELLKSTDLSIAEVAFAVGYSAEAAFCRVFKKNTQLTPLKYRMSQR